MILPIYISAVVIFPIAFNYAYEAQWRPKNIQILLRSLEEQKMHMIS